MSFVIYLIYASIYIGLIATTFYIIGYTQDKKKKKPLYSDEELPKVSILVPAWNEEESIAKTIESLFSSDYPSEQSEQSKVDGSGARTSL